MKKTTITPSVEQIINDALAIEAESAQDAGAFLLPLKDGAAAPP